MTCMTTLLVNSLLLIRVLMTCMTTLLVTSLLLIRVLMTCMTTLLVNSLLLINLGFLGAYDLQILAFHLGMGRAFGGGDLHAQAFDWQSF